MKYLKTLDAILIISEIPPYISIEEAIKYSVELTIKKISSLKIVRINIIGVKIIIEF